MGTAAATPGTKEYRVLLVRPESHRVLVFTRGGFLRIPRVSIPLMSRPAEQLQKAIKATWGISAFVLDARAATHGDSSYVWAEQLSPAICSALEEVEADRLMNSEFNSIER